MGIVRLREGKSTGHREARVLSDKEMAEPAAHDMPLLHKSALWNDTLQPGRVGTIFVPTREQPSLTAWAQGRAHPTGLDHADHNNRGQTTVCRSFLPENRGLSPVVVLWVVVKVVQPLELHTLAVFRARIGSSAKTLN